jgi:hypothetical protein
MEDAENFDVPGVPSNHVSDSVGVVDEDAHLAVSDVPITFSEPGVFSEGLAAAWSSLTTRLAASGFSAAM